MTKEMTKLERAVAMTKFANQQREERNKKQQREAERAVTPQHLEWILSGVNQNDSHS